MKPLVEWVVQEGDGNTVADVIATLGDYGDAASLRVRLNGRRATTDAPIEPGDRVELLPAPRARTDDGVHVLTQRDGVLLAYKPAGLPSEPTRQGESSMVTVLGALHGGAKVHAASRLDVPVSGVMMCTLGRDATRRVTRWRELQQIARTYLAIAVVKAEALEDEGTWDCALRRGRGSGGRPQMLAGNGKAALSAETRFRVLSRAARGFLLELKPQTGRMHQLRAHTSIAGCPLLGDSLYGAPRRQVDGSGAVHELRRIALHAHRVDTPTLRATAAVPAELGDIWKRCGGSDSDWP